MLAFRHNPVTVASQSPRNSSGKWSFKRNYYVCLLLQFQFQVTKPAGVAQPFRKPMCQAYVMAYNPGTYVEGFWWFEVWMALRGANVCQLFASMLILSLCYKIHNVKDPLVSNGHVQRPNAANQSPIWFFRQDQVYSPYDNNNIAHCSQPRDNTLVLLIPHLW